MGSLLRASGGGAYYVVCLYESAGTGGARRAWERSASAEGCPGGRASGVAGMRAEGGVEC